MAEIGTAVAVLSVAAKIAKNLYIFKQKAETCSDIIKDILQSVRNVERDRDLVKRVVAELNRRPNAATLTSDLLKALESLERPLNDLDQKLGDLNAGEPTWLGRLVLTYRYEACRDVLESSQRQIDNGYRSLQLALSIAQLYIVRQDSAATDRTRPPTPQSINSSEHRSRSDASTVYGEQASELFRATERLKVTKVKELLDAGASPESRDPQGRTLIDVAVTLGGRHSNQDRMVEVLLLKGAKFTCTDPASVKLYREIISTIKFMKQKRKK